ncbi:MAG: histidine phosphatase family protein [Janthinobacterium lividum]
MARGLILAARHPRPLLTGRVCYGRADVPLAEPPERGAAALLAAVPEPIERIISSPASRAVLVARALARETGAPLHLDDRLQEMDFAAWENQAWSALPRAEIDAWAADPLRYRPGGGENVEAVLARVRRAWTGIASSADTTLVVTHAGPIRCLLHLVRGVPLLTAIQAGIAYGAVERFEARS